MLALFNTIAVNLNAFTILASGGDMTLYIILAVLIFLFIGALTVLGVRIIPNDRVGIVEKLWSFKGSVNEGRIMAFNGQAGYEAKLLRGGIHLGKWFWQYRIHKVPLVTIPQGKIGYVYARDGEALTPGQTLAQLIECGNFQDAEKFLSRSVAKRISTEGETEEVVVGQRGRQRAILRE